MFSFFIIVSQLQRLKKAEIHANQFAALVKEANISDARSQLEVTVCLIVSLHLYTTDSMIRHIAPGCLQRWRLSSATGLKYPIVLLFHS